MTWRQNRQRSDSILVLAPICPVHLTASPQAYPLFLEANALVGAGDSNIRKALALYDEALALDPRFARALAARAAARLVLVRHGSVGLADLRRRNATREPPLRLMPTSRPRTRHWRTCCGCAASGCRRTRRPPPHAQAHGPRTRVARWG
jgi:hypothetical protein